MGARKKVLASSLTYRALRGNRSLANAANISIQRQRRTVCKSYERGIRQQNSSGGAIAGLRRLKSRTAALVPDIDSNVEGNNGTRDGSGKRHRSPLGTAEKSPQSYLRSTFGSRRGQCKSTSASSRGVRERLSLQNTGYKAIEDRASNSRKDPTLKLQSSKGDRLDIIKLRQVMPVRHSYQLWCRYARILEVVV